MNSTVAKFTTVQIEKEIVENSTTEFFYVFQTETTISKMETVQIKGARKVTRKLNFYNLDMIISFDYHLESKHIGNILKKKN